VSQLIKDAQAIYANFGPMENNFRILQGFEGVCPNISEFLTVG